MDQRPIQLTAEELREVKRIVNEIIPECEVWAFGSRVRGQARRYSDLDLAILTKEPLPLQRMAELKEAFAESDLVFKVDVVDWSVASESFRKIIEAEKVVIKR